ncbi:hypothetical protein, partial [Aurantimonas sp. C2-3-R2]|uniref:hypothetical protein n=1 Tax=Aurantimonas sp. C2-3-R2 TaxID=3114363 RepID=UPI002E17613F|nr:hypothetical protein [Aurantimonas sp. C2-3-R2]
MQDPESYVIVSSKRERRAVCCCRAIKPRKYPKLGDTRGLNRPGFPGDCLVCILRGDRHGLKLGVVGVFCLGGRNVADRL